MQDFQGGIHQGYRISASDAWWCKQAMHVHDTHLSILACTFEACSASPAEGKPGPGCYLAEANDQVPACLLQVMLEAQANL